MPDQNRPACAHPSCAEPTMEGSLYCSITCERATADKGGTDRPASPAGPESAVPSPS